MKAWIISAGLAIVLGAGTSSAQTAAQTQPANTSSMAVDNKAVVGVWRAQMGDIPVFTMVIIDEGGGGLSGAIVFYLLRRDIPDQKPTATPGNPEPLLHPAFDGKTLTFQISHRRAHPPRTLNDPPITLSFKAPEHGKPEIFQFEGQSVTLTRAEY
jgi:hypothetical protein